MLKQLLNLLQRDDGIQRVEKLAAELGTSPAQVLQMLDELVRRGYLKRTSMACSETQCNSCPLTQFCASGADRQTQVYTLQTKKIST